MKDLVTSSNTSGRPTSGAGAPATSLSGGQAAQVQATAPGTAGAPQPGGMGQPMVPPVGGGAGKGAAKETARVIQTEEDVTKHGLNSVQEAVLGGTVCRGDEQPKAS